MSTLSLRLPDSMHSRLREWARKDNISINQFITSAVTEKLSALSTQEYLQERADRASRAGFDAALAKVLDALPDEADRWEWFVMG
jgi:predicted transcriptional regulator